MRRAYVFLLLLMPAAACLAATTELAFMRYFPGARYAAMGGALTGLPAEADSVFFSPAGLYLLKGTKLSFSHAEYFAGSRYEAVSAVRQFGDSTAVAVSALYFWTGTQDRRDGFGVSSGTFSPFQVVPAFSVSRGLTKEIALGLNIKFPYENLDGNEALRILYDISGFLCLSDSVSFCVCLVNAGIHQDLPALFKTGLGVSSGVIKADIDAEFQNAGSPVYAAGISVRPEEFLTLLAGVRYDAGTPWNILNCFSFGVEIGVRPFALSYGIKLSDALADTHYASLIVQLE